MQEILNAVKDTPIPTILVVSGIVFLLLSVADQFAGKISISPARQRVAAAIGSVLIVLGIGLYIFPRASLPQEPPSDETQTGPPSRIPGYGALEGRVTNKDGEAAQMWIYLNLDGEEIGFKLSKKQMGGFFQFLKLKPGIYEIHVARAGGNYRPQRIKNVKIKAGVLTTLDIKLSEGDDLQRIDNPVTKDQPIEAETNP